MGIKDTLSGFVPDKYKPPVEVTSLDDFVGTVEKGEGHEITVIPSVRYIPASEDRLHSNQFFIALNSQSKKGRTIKYEHIVGEVTWKTGALNTIVDERTRVGMGRTLLSTVHLTDSIEKRVRGIQVVISDNDGILDGERLTGLLEEAKEAKLVSWEEIIS